MRFEVLLVSALLLAGCGSKEEKAARMTGGDPGRGKVAIRLYGCAACHTIPGIEGATGSLGPSLDRIGSRDYLAGKLENNPENMMRWIRDPQGIQPGSPMPDLRITEQDGRDIAAYLYTLE